MCFKNLNSKKSKFFGNHISIFSWTKQNSLVKIISGSLVELPTPRRIRTIWNFGSLLGLCLVIQIITGLFLAIHYSRELRRAFFSIRHIIRDVNYGWLIRIIHANGARIFFIIIYLHMARGIYYGSFKINHTWIIGVTILFVVIATAFLGYVLPWGQISFWGATVITNLFSAIPVLGENIVYWLWGGFAVRGPTLSRFFAIHFILPFILAGLVLIHLLFLHQTGSSNPLGLNRNLDKISFHPYFIYKDLIGFFLFFIFYINLNFLGPWVLGDTENFVIANPLVTPIHIQPEWYFLFAYAILRSIPNKLGGVIALVAAVAVFYLIPLTKKSQIFGSFQPLHKILFWLLVRLIIILTWIGARSVEEPYVLIGQISTFFYFLIFLIWLIWFYSLYKILICGIKELIS